MGVYGHCSEICLAMAVQIQICAILCRFASFLRHWELKIPTGTCFCMCTMSGASQLLTVEPTVTHGIHLHGLISLQLQWKWEQLCGSIGGWPSSSHSSAMKHQSPILKRGSAYPRGKMVGMGSVREVESREAPCPGSKPGHVLIELPWAHPSSGSVSISKNFQ